MYKLVLISLTLIASQLVYGKTLLLTPEEEPKINMTRALVEITVGEKYSEIFGEHTFEVIRNNKGEEKINLLIQRNEENILTDKHQALNVYENN
jgi:hypothetical protein